MPNVFKPWVPEWLIKFILFSGMMPSMVLFFLPMANIPVTAGFYGCEPTDVQFLIVLFYAGFAGFYVLERRFFEYMNTKNYYVIFNLIQIVNCILMYCVKDIEWIYGLRFFQGMIFASAVNLCISTIFSRLKSDRAKEGSYVVFFGMLLCSSPFNTFVTADFIDSFNFDELYLYAACSFVPGLILVMLCMKSIYRPKAYPLWSLDYASFIIYSLGIICYGYMMVYGQQRYWFYDNSILLAGIVLLGCILIFCIRQQHLKRIYIHLPIFRSANFLLGCLVLFIMYIERFSLAITNQYFLQELNFDPIHLSTIQWFNIAGIVVGVVISFYALLAKHSVKWMWSFGFLSLLIFHQVMFFSFEGDGNETYFYIPLVLHGLGVGLVMVPTILFVISSVPKVYGISAAAVCLAIRYLGFTSSIGLQNFFKLMGTSTHQEAFQTQTQVSNPVFRNYLSQEVVYLSQHGMVYREQTAAFKLLIEQVRSQSFVRFAMDYYEWMSLISLVLIMIILFFPSLKTMYQKMKNNIISPA